MKIKWLSAAIIGGSLMLAACSSNTASDSQKATKSTDIQKIKDQVIPASDPSKSPAQANNRKDTFVAAISNPGGVFLPYFYHNGWDGNVTSVMFEQLISFDKTGKPVPDLAKSWDISSDNLTYTFHMKKGLTFSNGKPLTADDVAFTLTLLLDPAYDGDTDLSQAYIKGADAYKKGNASSVSGIQVVDPLTVKITTTKVNAQALELIGGPVLSKDYYGKGYKKGKLDYLKPLFSKPMGAGPYVLDKYVPGQEVDFTANPHFYSGKPKVEHFIYKVTSPDTKVQLFQTGETDYDGFTPDQDTLDQLKGLGFANLDLYTSSDYGYIMVNHKKPYLKDKRVTQALIYGLERQKIVNAIFQGNGMVANEPISPVSWAYTPDVNPYQYNLKKAKQLLDEAGWKAGSNGIRTKDGKQLSISYLTSTTGLGNDIFISIAKEDFKKLGINFNPEIVDFNALLDKAYKGDYDLAAVRTSQIIDPSEPLQEFLSNNSQNISGYSNQKVDQLINEGVSTLDITKRKEIYKQLYKEISDDPPYIFMYYRKALAAYNSRIKGLEPDPFNGILTSLPKLSIKE